VSGKKQIPRAINKIGSRDDGGGKFFNNLVKLEGVMRKTKWNALILTSALALTFLGPQTNAMSQPGKQSQSGEQAKQKASQSVTIYRVSYKVNELENGKTINSRSYTLMAQPDKTARLRVGSRVPYASGKGSQFSFQDISMNIDCTLNKHEDSLIVDTRLSTNILKGKEKMSGDSSIPVFGTLELTDATTATVGKPAFVGSIDDVGSNRRYVIEVTVTKAK
jgi:hypothetical protein